MTAGDDTSRFVWTRDGTDWPHREHSSFVEAGGVVWHVQTLGTGPTMLLLHGTAASTHSWRDLVPRLASEFSLIVPDLPGHAFSSPLARAETTLSGMSRALAALLRKLDASPAIAVGHSAGAALLLRLAIDGAIAPRSIVSLNGALLPFGGFAGVVFSPLAKLIAANDLATRFFVRMGRDGGRVDSTLAGTGSTLDEAGLAYYRRLFGSEGHVANALQMMAGWDLTGLKADLKSLSTPLLLVTGGEDRAVPAEVAFEVRDLVPGARVVYLRDLGHLAHEERPAEIADLLRVEAVERGALAAPCSGRPDRTDTSTQDPRSGSSG
jgi:magnesium chelatase accessory protein